MASSPPLELDLERIATLARVRHEDTQAFVHYVDVLWERENRPDAELDALVEQIAAEVSARVDCTACANCCRHLTVGLTPEDIPPLAQALRVSPEAVIARYVDKEAGAREGEWGVICCSPCPFLVGTRCAHYAARPQSCRDYPAFTPDFRWLMPQIVLGMGLCPIIYNVIERLKVRLGW